ncbi:Tm-1-like ATP-binding domain-containing protein, partial [Aspergillus ibericus CBS 121593]
PSLLHILPSLPRTTYIQTITTTLIPTIRTLHQHSKIHTIISLGGSCGTAIATTLMREALPIGFPKVMVSTMASGDVQPYVQETDITMMYSVVDVAGMNGILERVLRNAAAAGEGMARAYFQGCVEGGEEGDGDADGGEGGGGGKKRIGITMFGVTTPGVTRIREFLEDHYRGQSNEESAAAAAASGGDGCEVYVFHATGAGGKAMERLIRETHLDAVVDLTTSEIVDEIVGGVLSAGSTRLSAAAEKGIPQVVSLGACDMINFGTPETVPERFAGRRIYEHNPTVTIVRTDEEESRRVGRFIADKLKQAIRPDKVVVLIPEGGLSMMDVPGQQFHDPQANEALFDTLEKELQNTGITVTRHPRDVNHPEFAQAVGTTLIKLLDGS